MSALPLVPVRWRRPAFFVVSAACVLAVLATARDVLFPFVLAPMLAYLLTPLVAWVEARGLRRGAAILLVYFVLLGSIGLAVRLCAPRVATEIGHLRRELPHQMQVAKQRWVAGAQERLESSGALTSSAVESRPPDPAVVVKPEADGGYAVSIGSGFVIVARGQSGFEILPREPPAGKLDLSKMVDEAARKSADYLQTNAVELLKIGGNLVAATIRGVFIFGITLMLSAYIMLSRDKIVAYAASLLAPGSRAGFASLLARIDRGLSGVVRGQLMICLINGVLSAIGFALIGLKYWPVLALVAMVLSIIPIFGSIISSVPAVALGLTQSIGTALFVLVWIIAIHQLEANLLNPKIMGDAARIHPVLVVFSLIAGEHFFHAAGALLAVPCMSIVQSLFLHFEAVFSDDSPLPQEAPPPVSIAEGAPPG